MGFGKRFESKEEEDSEVKNQILQTPEKKEKAEKEESGKEKTEGKEGQNEKNTEDVDQDVEKKKEGSDETQKESKLDKLKEKFESFKEGLFKKEEDGQKKEGEQKKEGDQKEGGLPNTLDQYKIDNSDRHLEKQAMEDMAAGKNKRPEGGVEREPGKTYRQQLEETEDGDAPEQNKDNAEE